MSNDSPAAPPRKREVCIWAVATNTECIPCEDARYHAGKDWPSTDSFSPHGTQHDGAVGWDWGVSFSSFKRLIEKITTESPPDHVCGAKFYESCAPLTDHQVGALGIDAHGFPGLVDIDCHSQLNQGLIPESATYDVLSVPTLSKYSSQLQELDRLLAKDHGVLMFAGCKTGSGVSGSEFLIEVSKLLPGRDIIAFTNITYTHPHQTKRQISTLKAGVCNQPGTRDTPFPFSVGDDRQAENWHNLAIMPWASRASPHAKVARDGKIVGGSGKDD